MNIENDGDAGILPGLKPVLELLERDPSRVDMVYVRRGRVSGESARVLDLCRASGVRFSLVDEPALARMAGKSGHQGVAARLRETGLADWDELLDSVPAAPLPLLVALDQVRDPGNVGTLARTLYALGAAGMVLPRHNSAFLGPGARRSAAGALERLPIAQVTNLARAVDDAAERGFFTFAARKAENALDPLSEPLPTPALLVLGGEQDGIRPGVARRCGASLCIPFRRDFDSLNVAQAGAILVSCFSRCAGSSKA
ncbi:MAG: 23S rRNA (guanosine(2251)-2'-O)-methyltransferase RlmB [Mailhella sp.]|nr:23S rRNA (guanosine(2251)-2'-O)-methyltransferase RlmB [Mailhella sp.]